MLRHTDEFLAEDWLNGFINDAGINLKLHAALVSGGGNDFIEAALNVALDEGILIDFKDKAVPLPSDQCCDAARGTVLTNFLRQNFDHIYKTIRSSKLAADSTICLNQYDVPTVRDAQARIVGKSCLFESFRRHSIRPALYQSLGAALFQQLRSKITTWTTGKTSIAPVHTYCTLRPAPAISTGRSGDWQNKIHPSAEGWRKMASVWQCTVVL
jgi:hypothetical protein